VEATIHLLEEVSSYKKGKTVVVYYKGLDILKQLIENDVGEIKR